jgi:hypothetical protein
VKPEESQFFSKKTILDLKNIQWVEETTIYQALQKGKLTYQGTLEETIIQELESAIRNAETLSLRDIKILLCEE